MAAPVPFSRRVVKGLAELGLVFLVLTGVGLWRSREMPTGPAPAFVLPTLEGGQSSLASLEGRPAVLYFWATWCGVCSQQSPVISALAAEHPVLAITSTSGAPADIARYVSERGYRFPVVWDPNEAVVAQWKVRAFPTTVVLDRHGRIRFTEVGYTTGLGLRARLWLAGLMSD